MIHNVLQERITIRGTGTGTVVQTASEWLDLETFATASFWLEVVAVTNPGFGSVTLTYETAPIADSSMFQAMASVTLTVTTSPIITQSIFCNVPLARFVRWKLAGTQAGTWDATFHIYFTQTTGAQPATPRGAGGWATAVDLDFTAQASQTLGSDLNYTIGGLKFKKENSAGDATPMALTMGTGLVVVPKSSTTVDNTGRTAPLLFLPLSELGIANLDMSTGLRVFLYVSAANYAANYDNSWLSIGTDSNQWTYGLYRGELASTVSMWLGRFTGGSRLNSNGFVPAGGIDKTHNNVMVIEAHRLNGWQYWAGLGTYNAAFPSLPFANALQDSDALGGFGNILIQAGGDPTVLGVTIATLRANSGTNLSVTYARMRIDYRT
jgi:hypothetical protein